MSCWKGSWKIHFIYFAAVYVKLKELNFIKTIFYVQNRFSRPKIDPHVNFNNFQAEENFFIFKIFGMSR